MKNTTGKNRLIMDPDEFGVKNWDGTWVETPPDDFPRYDLHALFEYTYSVGKSTPADLTEEERERFRIK